MFIDICFSNNEEEKLLQYAKKINTVNIYFINSKKNYDFKIKNTPKFFDFGKNIQKKHICIVQNLNSERKFNSPMKINHVYFKDLKENHCFILFPISELIKKPENMEKWKFIANLTKKYRIPVIVCSFAKKSIEIVQFKTLVSYCNMLNLDKNSVFSFYNYLTQDF